MTRPDDARVLVVFATPHRQRDRELAALLQKRGLATLILELDPQVMLDPDAVAHHFGVALDELTARGLDRELAIGLLGEGSAATAALATAAARPEVSTVVSWNGRPDLALASLATLRAPTLFVAGSRDTDLLRIAHASGKLMVAHHEVVAISGVSREFAAAGAIAETAAILADWFTRHGRAPDANPNSWRSS